jgi:hypothetical protein
MTCTGAGIAVAGQYRNLGVATGQPPCGPAVTASDPSHYYGRTPSIGIEKLINGQEADDPPYPVLHVGDPILWTFVVTNTGDKVLSNVTVTDSQGVAVSCPKTTLAAGESMTCVANGTAVSGTHVNTGTATGKALGATVTASDPAGYVAQAPDVSSGCTPGYWKNHTDSWPPTGYTTGQSVLSVFVASARFPALANDTLLAALAYGGGSDLRGAAEILLRAGVAALLNAAHPGVASPRTPDSVIADVDAALAGTRDQMLALAAALDADNNLGCPLH